MVLFGTPFKLMKYNKETIKGIEINKNLGLY
jgi:hypothetical protein